MYVYGKKGKNLKPESRKTKRDKALRLVVATWAKFMILFLMIYFLGGCYQRDLGGEEVGGRAEYGSELGLSMSQEGNFLFKDLK